MAMDENTATGINRKKFIEVAEVNRIMTGNRYYSGNRAPLCALEPAAFYQEIVT
jgi:hypothetical protein